jgi:4'-phosphopantetheinyl transferase
MWLPPAPSGRGREGRVRSSGRLGGGTGLYSASVSTAFETGRLKRANEGTPWTLGPRAPHLAAGSIHVWRADLTLIPDDLAQLLCAAERARAGDILDERKRALWTRSRGLLRMLLSRYLAEDPRGLRLASGARGKPYLLEGSSQSSEAEQRSGGRAIPIEFNLAHSRSLALYAVSAVGAVGVDVEMARRPMDIVAIARRSLGAVEAARIESLDPAERQREFLRSWTRHEAASKCLGTGIFAADDGAGERPRWVVDLDVGPTAAAALAAEHPAGALSCWEWTG